MLWLMGVGLCWMLLRSSPRLPFKASLATRSFITRQSVAHHLRCANATPITAPTPCAASPVPQGEPGDLFYIIKEGEAVVYQDSGAGSRKRVNQLFKADFFGEGALLSDEPRWVAGLGACLGCGWVDGWEGKLGRNTPGKH
jgi:hypothetical protein